LRVNKEEAEHKEYKCRRRCECSDYCIGREHFPEPGPAGLVRIGPGIVQPSVSPLPVIVSCDEVPTEDKTQIGDADSVEVEGIPEDGIWTRYIWTGSCFEIEDNLSEAEQARASSAAAQWNNNPMIRIGAIDDDGYNKNPRGVSPEYRKQCKKAYQDMLLSEYGSPLQVRSGLSHSSTSRTYEEVMGMTRAQTVAWLWDGTRDGDTEGHSDAESEN
jgi:hypothetical protein